MRRFPWFTALLLLAMILAAVFAPWLAPHPPLEGDLLRQHLPPAWLPGGDPAFPLGTDEQGRDILSNILYGLRVSLSAACSPATAAASASSSCGRWTSSSRSPPF